MSECGDEVEMWVCNREKCQLSCFQTPLGRILGKIIRTRASTLHQQKVRLVYSNAAQFLSRFRLTDKPKVPSDGL